MAWPAVSSVNGEEMGDCSARLGPQLTLLEAVAALPFRLPLLPFPPPPPLAARAGPVPGSANPMLPSGFEFWANGDH